MNQKHIHVFAKWQVKEGQVDVVLKLLEVVARKSTEEKGNLFYNIHQSNSDHQTILLYEGYTDEKALDEHRNSEHFRNLVMESIVPLLEHREVILTTQII